MKRWLIPSLAITLLAFTASAQLTPDKALKTLKTSDGLETTLWAAEPLFTNPTSMDIDHKGRVWVCESVNYRDKLRGKKVVRRPEGDRVLILEDSKGTGKADKATVFYQAPEIHAPIGIVVRPHTNGVGQTVYLCQSPDILVLEDKDGDGKADGPPRKLLSGFKGVDHDHGVHGLLIGPDNKFYFSVGDQGVSGLVDKNGKKWNSNNTDCRAGTNWRCDLDGKNLELLAHNFRNQYEPCVDSFGTQFVSDNDDDGNQQTRICYVMPGGNYGYHPRGKGQTHWHEEQPGVVPKILRTYFGSPTGMCVYEGSLLPTKYQGQLLHTDAGPRHLRCYHLTPDGAGYKVEQENMITSTDNWFRPSDVCVAPDGSVFVADWYDPGVGGHGMGDTTRGRIFRVAPPGNMPSVPKVETETVKGCRDALASPNLAVRAMAMATLDEVGLKQSLEVLEPAAVQKENVWLRARALWQMGRLGSLRFVKAAFSDPDPRFRVLAMRIWADCKNHTPEQYTEPNKAALIKDDSSAVRREALLLLQNVNTSAAKPLIYELAKRYDGKDRFYLNAVGIAVGNNDKKRRDEILADFNKHFPTWNDAMAGLIFELRPPSVLALLEKQLADPKLAASRRSQIVDILANAPELDAGLALLKSLEKETSPDVRARIVENLNLHLPGKWTKLREADQLDGILTKLLAQPDTRLAALSLIGAAEKTSAALKVIGVANDDKETLQVRAAAIRTLGQLKGGDITWALVGLTGQKDKNELLAIEAAQALGKQPMGAGEAQLQLLAADNAKFSLGVRQAAIAGLSGTQNGTAWLLDSIEKKKLNEDLLPDLGRLLRNSPFQAMRNKALVLLPAPAKFDPKNLPSIPALLARKGDAKKGKAIWQASAKSEASCMKCHVVNGQGGMIGPDLSVIGSKVSRENLLESILYPSRAISDQFVMYIVETADGKAINGLLIEDTPTHILLRDANGKDYKLSIAAKDVVSKKKSDISIMPNDLHSHLSEEQLIDLVEYLYSLKSPAATSSRLTIPERERELLVWDYRPGLALSTSASAFVKSVRPIRLVW